ncbi:ATP-binding protein [Monashia sp. NPDC004114]
MNRVVTLAGFGGVGKTRLAARVVDELGPGFADGAFLVALADLTDTGLLGHTVAGALGLQVPGSGWDPAVLTDFLRDRQVILWLDNCEHLVDDVAPLVARLVRECPGVAVLATSRMPLGIAGEAVYDVPPMDLPPTGVPEGSELAPEDLVGFDAVELFVVRAQAASASFRLVPENAAAVAELVGVLDGIPLAVELAAARVRVAAPEVMVRRAHELRLLDGRLVDAPVRHRSMVASVEWSYRLCPPDEQAVWRRLSVFVGGFDIEAAETVCAAGDLVAESVLAPLLSLADKSIISADPDHAGRYRMLEPTRQYAARQAGQADDLARSREAHLAWVEALTGDLWSHWSGPDQVAWMTRMRLELPNLRAALEHAVADPGTSPVALRICRNLEPYWGCEGSFNEARHWIDLALDQPSGSPAERARAAATASLFAAAQLDLSYSHARLAECAELVAMVHHDAGRPGGAHKWVDECFAHTCYHIAAGTSALYDGQLDAADEHLVTAAAELERTGQVGEHLHLQARYVLALLRLGQGDLAEVSRLTTTSLSLSESRHELYMRAPVHWVLGLTALGTGEVVAAQPHHERALQIAMQLGDNTQTAMNLEALGWVAAARGLGARAATLFGAAETMWRAIRLPLPSSQPFAQFRAAAVAAARAAIGPEDYERSYTHGMTIGTPAALTVALSEDAAGDRSTVVANEARRPSLDPLTPREADIAGLVAEGLSNREIAARLVISERTVHGHIRNILTKLDATSRAKIASWYVQQTEAGAGQNADA